MSKRNDNAKNIIYFYASIYYMVLCRGIGNQNNNSNNIYLKSSIQTCSIDYKTIMTMTMNDNDNEN